MTKKRTMNELRQTKDTHYVNPTFKTGTSAADTEVIAADGVPLNTPRNIASKEGKKYLDIAGDPDLIEAAKQQIVKQLQDDFYDLIFQAVADKMEQNYLFRQNNYLTEAGEEIFEDAWFEWYHNHHGDILSAVLKNLGH